MTQPFIFKRQILSIIILLIILLLEIAFMIDYKVQLVTVFVLIGTLSNTFLPIGTQFLKNTKYFDLYQPVLFHIKHLLPLIFFQQISFNVLKNDLLGVVLGFLSAILLLLFNYKKNLKFISDDNIMIFTPIKKDEIVEKIYISILSPITEELFYRFFVIGILYNQFGYYAVLISTVVFVHAHYTNRWADKLFNLKSYLFQCLASIIFGFLYITTGSLLGCIFAHLLINSLHLIVVYKRIRNKEKSQQVTFDDYL